jgi:hypothetical protein
VGTSTSAWKASTFFSKAGAVVDTQFGGQTNIWQVTVAGKSGASNPFTSNPTSGVTTVTDGTVTWKNVASTNSGDSAWAASTAFAANHLIVANAAGTNSLFQLQTNTFPNFKLVAAVYVTAKFYDHVHAFAHIAGNGARVPVIGVPSASACAGMTHDAAAYNLYRIGGGPGAFICEVVSRGLRPTGAVEELNRFDLSWSGSE